VTGLKLGPLFFAILSSGFAMAATRAALFGCQINYATAVRGTGACYYPAILKQQKGP